MKLHFLQSSPAYELGVLSALLERLFFSLQYVSPANIFFKTRKQSQESAKSPEERQQKFLWRSKQIERYVLTLLILEVAAFLVVAIPVRFLPTLALVIAAWRVLDLFQASINIAVLDHLRVRARSAYVASSVRTALLSLINFGESILCFAVIYAFDIRNLSGAVGRRDSLYFSVITQLTVGYGDLKPQGPLRLVAACQALLGFVLAVVLIARLISLLPPLKGFVESEEANPPVAEPKNPKG